MYIDNKHKKGVAMRHGVRITIVIVITLFATCAVAQSQTIHTRFDKSEGKEGALTLAYWGKSVDLWVFRADTDNKDIEVGKMFPVLKRNGHTVLAGGYLAYITGPKEWHVLPWVIVTGPAFGGAYKIALADYIPLNGGKHYLFSTESSQMWGTGKIRYGVAGNLAMPEGGDLNLGVGPKLSFSQQRWIASARVLRSSLNGSLSTRVTLDYRF